MNRSLWQKVRGRLAALGRKGVASVAMLALLAMLVPSPAWAGTPYSLHWVHTEENPTCETAALSNHNGEAFFHVNGTPLPGFEIPGAFMTRADGAETNTIETAFNSVLLRTGPNGFLFHVANDSGDDSCVHSHEVVNLVSAPLGLNKPLFDVRRDGIAFAGSTELDLSLAEINPPLARDIENLETALAAARTALIANASTIEGLAEKLSLLQQLDTELHDLVTRPLDEIAQTDLDAILDRYAEIVDEATKAALDELVLDLHQSVLELENELTSLLEVFGAQADAVANVVTLNAQGAGFSPDDPSGYGLGPAQLPWITIPDLSHVPGAFDPGHDPYAAYADLVIASLKDDVNAGKDSHRADFVANVRAWRENQTALEKALQQRPYLTQAETSAFLHAQNRVTSFVQQFMDGSDWFLDSPVPADLRAAVDGILKQAFGALADQLKDGLNQWQGSALSPEQSHMAQTTTAFAAAMSAIGVDFGPYTETMETLTYAAVRVGVGFVPVVGTALDLCEAITGKEWCLPSGKELSTEERIFSGAGAAVGGVVKFWKGVKNAGASQGVIQVAEKTGQLGDDFVKAMNATRRTWYKTLQHGAVTSKLIDAFEAKAGKSLLDEGHALLGVGDDGVRKVLKMDPGDRACDFLSVNKGNKLVLGEAKGIEAATNGGKGGVDAEHAVSQLKSTLEKLKEQGLAGDVDRLEIRMPKGAPFKNQDLGIKDGYLIKWSTGKPVAIDGFNKVFVKIIQI
jgi:hypothetical protein